MGERFPSNDDSQPSLEEQVRRDVEAAAARASRKAQEKKPADASKALENLPAQIRGTAAYQNYRELSSDLKTRVMERYAKMNSAVLERTKVGPTMDQAAAHFSSAMDELVVHLQDRRQEAEKKRVQREYDLEKAKFQEPQPGESIAA